LYPQEAEGAGTSRQEAEGAGTSQQEAEGVGTSQQEAEGARTKSEGEIYAGFIYEERAVSSTSKRGVAAGSVPQKDERAWTSDDEDDDIMEVVGETEEEDEERLDPEIHIICPLFKITRMCDWFGRLKHLVTHVRESHRDIFRRGSNFEFESADQKVLLILFNGEIFLYYQVFSEGGHLYAAVQQVGTTDRKYNYKIRVLSYEEGTDDIKQIFRTKSTGVSFRVIFDAAICLAIGKDRLDPYMKNNSINIRVRIIEAPARKPTE
jgi:hypothetical protein